MTYSNIDRNPFGTNVPVSKIIMPPAEANNAVSEDVYHKECDAVVKDEICIQADLKIDPKLCVGEIKTFCGDAKIGKCGRVSCQHDPCEFSVSQKICIEVPLKFSADVKVESIGHICGEPEVKPYHNCE